MTRPSSSAPALVAEVDDEPSSVRSVCVCHANEGMVGRLIRKAANSSLTAAQTLRMFRIRSGMTLGRAATSYGVTPDAWGNWEHGRTRMDADALLWIVRKCEEIGR